MPQIEANVLRRVGAKCLIGALAVALLTLVCYQLRWNLATVGFLYLIIVVLLSITGDFFSSAFVSSLAVVCLDYFFAPPAFSLWVVDRLNVVAIAAFLTTSLVITRQVSRLREMTDEALISIHRKLIDAEERERTRIARELHDDINQRISLVALDLAQLEETPSASVAELSSYIQKLLQRVSEIGADLHTISRGLHCFGLDILGIAASAKSYCVEFAQRQKVEIDFKSHDVPSPLDVPMYRLFTDDDHVKKPNIPTEDIQRRLVNAKQERELRAFAKFISRMGDKNRGLLFHMASKMANRA